MPYVFLTFAVIFFSVQFLFSKGFQLKMGDGLSQILLFTAFMSMGIVAEFFVYQRFQLEFSFLSFLYAFFYAVLLLVCEISSLKAFGLGKVSIVSLYALIGSVVLPFLYGILILRESIGFTKITAIILICISFIPPLFENNLKKEEKYGNKKLSFFILCLLVFLSNGLISVILKAHQMSKNIVSESNFLIWASVFSLLLSVLLLLFNKKKKDVKPIHMKRKTALICILLALGYGLFNGTGNIFSMICAKTLQSSIQFPVISGGVVSLTAILSFLAYKEKITGKIFLSIVLAVLSIIIFSL